ncbi:DUF885 domain-containing protein [Leifsonia sp. F6_8S_P_1B]|uniref:DUF885 domain-containing protein n=1 Tax=Leifsonia williamsii TaxID=3035919 RepID=A0ABT8KAV8_9MICO|nr:DUF885 domain-containing protein [Leifsonia williamsii]MDN4614589.1 DUF885 domain-containing protein [Leifsonia williamsii]
MSGSATREVADRHVSALAEHEPTAAQALGLASTRPLPDLSPEWAQERRALTRRTAAALRGAEPDGEADRSLHAAMTERMRSEAELFDTGFTARLLAPLASPVHEVRESFDDVVVTDDDAGDRVIERLQAVDGALADLRRRLGWARAAGRDSRFTGTGVAAARQVTAVADQIATWIDPRGIDYFSSIATAGLATARRQALDRAAASATAAFADLEDWLRSDLLPDAPREDAVGEHVYAQTARSFLGTELDLDEVYDYGWQELDRLFSEALSLSAQVLGGHVGDGGPGEVAAAARALDADQRHRVEGRANIVGWLNDRLDWTLETVGDAFDLPESIRDVDIVVPTAATGVVYYLPGAPDGSVRSKIVWTVPEGADAIGTWQEVTSFHHEGVPGHHLEHSINRANAGLHPWQRYLCEIHGYAEGWAHYSEQLSADLGLLRDPAERLGMVLGQLWRTVRIVADIGLHTGRRLRANPLGATGQWTPELARRFLTDIALVDPRTARFEVDRYLGWPGQALAFKVGAKLWTEARAAAGRAGASAADFHRRALGLGPMGLAPLRALLTDS